jgi:hypothetical protein
MLLEVHVVPVLIHEAAAEMQRVPSVLLQGLVRNEVQPVVLMAPTPRSIHLGPVQVSVVKRCEVVHVLAHGVVEVCVHSAGRIDTDVAAVRDYVEKYGLD